jgi:hypothetical protein
MTVELINTAEIIDLKKKLEDANLSLKYRNGENITLHNEIEQLHIFLDTLPNIPARKSTPPIKEDGTVETWNVDHRSVIVRLSSWLATSRVK